jgi:hypothetical protein
MKNQVHIIIIIFMLETLSRERTTLESELL